MLAVGVYENCSWATWDYMEPIRSIGGGANGWFLVECLCPNVDLNERTE